MSEYILVKDSPEHEAYMQSRAWDSRRIAALIRADHRCQLCNRADEMLHAHHRTYERLGDESPTDLIVLCHPCHTGFHRWEKRRRYFERTQPDLADGEILAALENVPAFPSSQKDRDGNEYWRAETLVAERPISELSNAELYGGRKPRV